MKTTRYQFERDIEGANGSNTDWLKQSLRSILESDKHFTLKADTIGYGINSLDQKIEGIDEQIKELQSVKKRLKEAKEIALTVGAEIFNDYGIDKLEGMGISSITIVTAKDKIDTELVIHDEEALMELGYYIKVLDTAKVMDDFTKADERAVLSSYCDVILSKTTTYPKLKINKRRNVNSTEVNDRSIDMEAA